VLRRATPADAGAITAILVEPEVARWWGPCDLESTLEEIPVAWVVLVDGAIAGWVLVSEEDTPEYRHAGIDVALTTALQGRGYGREAITVAIRHYIEHHGHHRFTIDPSAANARAIRTYEAVGFRPVGILRRYERLGDGPWRDGLLMDLLAEELAPPPRPLAP
jgi:aminoglycoside 6'-N-acetyltransferase